MARASYEHYSKDDARSLAAAAELASQARIDSQRHSRQALTRPIECCREQMAEVGAWEPNESGRSFFAP